MMHLFYLLNIPLRDGGHAYTETNLDRLVVEPWNFVSAAFLFNVFGLVAVHLMLLFLYRTRLAETR
jgi:hypothetical protein